MKINTIHFLILVFVQSLVFGATQNIHESKLLKYLKMKLHSSHEEMASERHVLRKRYAIRGKWKKHHLTYKINTYPSQMSTLGGKTGVEKIFEMSFKEWSDVADITFERVDNNQKIDIVIDFVKKNHGDGFPFNGPSGTYAHAFYPSIGQIHLDDEEPWTDHNTKWGINLHQLATHEIGHVLGVAHSSDVNSVMSSGYNHRENFALSQDDISAIQLLYGKKQKSAQNTPQNTPSPKFSLPPTPSRNLVTKKIVYDQSWYDWFFRTIG